MGLLKEIGWQLKLLGRNNIITISLLLTLGYLLIFFLIKSLGETESILVIFILNDPATIGLFFIGVSLLSERKIKLTDALNVIPISTNILLWAKVIALSLLGLVCGLIMAFAAIGVDFNLLLFIIATFGLSLLACFIGIWLSCYTDEFMKFILSTIPIIILIVNGSMLLLFGVIDNIILKLLPFNGAVQILSYSVGSNMYDGAQIWWHFLHLGLWIILGSWFSFRIYSKKIAK